MKKQISALLLAGLLLISLLAGCSDTIKISENGVDIDLSQVLPSELDVDIRLDENGPKVNIDLSQLLPGEEIEIPADLDSIPPYRGAAYIPVNDNTPFFTPEEITDQSFEDYAPLDSLGRCGITVASIGRDLMPTEKRESIRDVHPTGWHSVRYDWVDGKSLYNRCHLIGFQLAGENANERNLITGTRYLNIEGMLPFENITADYVKETGNHVMYRVTPIFTGSNLVADGVLMEGLSVEDQGQGVSFCIYAYNVQPGVEIDYKTGNSWAAAPSQSGDDTQGTYILNTSSHKFHLPTCSGAKDMNPKNKKTFTGSRQELIDKGYEPCRSCNP